jgi:hypothetical protein
MDNFERRHILDNDYAKKFIRYYYRYVDDILICWIGSDQQLTEFVEKINLAHPKIKFTVEEETNRKINFLDLTIIRKNNKHAFNIYRKPTYTDTTIHNSSQHPTTHKLAAYHSMVHRLLSIPMNKKHYNKELTTIKQIAKNNGYTHEIIDTIVKKHIKKNTHKLIYNGQNTENLKKQEIEYKVINYFGKISEKICKIQTKERVYTAFKMPMNLSRILNNGKDKINNKNKSGIYKLKCEECHSVYIGQTGRNFETRYQEHIRNYNKNSNFGNHLMQTGHKLNSGHSYKILHTMGKGARLNLLEQLEITKHRHNILLNDHMEFQRTPLIDIFGKQYNSKILKGGKTPPKNILVFNTGGPTRP